MDFKEKIDKILLGNDVGVNSVSALEDFVKTGRGAILDFYNKNRNPGPKTIKKIKGFPRLNLTWWEMGKGDVFRENGTSEIKIESEVEEKYNKIHLLQMLLERGDTIIALKDQLSQLEKEVVRLSALLKKEGKPGPP